LNGIAVNFGKLKYFYKIQIIEIIDNLLNKKFENKASKKRNVREILRTGISLIK